MFSCLCSNSGCRKNTQDAFCDLYIRGVIWSKSRPTAEFPLTGEGQVCTHQGIRVGKILQEKVSTRWRVLLLSKLSALPLR